MSCPRVTSIPPKSISKRIILSFFARTPGSLKERVYLFTDIAKNKEEEEELVNSGYNLKGLNEEGSFFDLDLHDLSTVRVVFCC